MRRTTIFLLSLLLLTMAGALAQDTPAITIHTTLPEGSIFTLGIHCRQTMSRTTMASMAYKVRCMETAGYASGVRLPRVFYPFI